MSQDFTSRYLGNFREYLLVVRGYSAHTAESYLRALVYLASHCEQEITEVAEDDLRRALKAKQAEVKAKAEAEGTEKEFTASSQQQWLSGWVHFFDYLISRQLAERNPARALSRPRKGKTTPKWVAEQEIQALLDQCGEKTAADIQLRTMIHILYATGMRISEMLSLSMSDVVARGDGTVMVKGKGDKHRVVPLGQAAGEMVLRYLSAARPALNPLRNDALFPSKRVPHKPLSRQIVFKWLKDLAAPLGIEISAHGFRHSCATHMLAGGAELPHIQHQLGHSNLQTTEIYADVLDDTLRDALEEHHPLSEKTSIS